MTAMVDFLIPNTIENPEDLAAMLEALPSYDALAPTSGEPTVFDDEQEPPTGLINLIRKNSEPKESTFTPSETVRLTN